MKLLKSIILLLIITQFLACSEREVIMFTGKTISDNDIKSIDKISNNSDCKINFYTNSKDSNNDGNINSKDSNNNANTNLETNLDVGSKDKNNYSLQIKDLFNNQNTNKLIKDDIEKMIETNLLDKKTLNLINNILGDDNKQVKETKDKDDLFVELFKIFLEEKKQVSEEQKKTIDYYIKTNDDSRKNFEYFVYFVGAILVFIGTIIIAIAFTIFYIAKTLGLWQKDKINTYEKEFNNSKNNLEELKLELNKMLKMWDKEVITINKQSSNFEEKFSNIETLEEELLDLIDRIKETSNYQTNILEKDSERITQKTSNNITSPNPFKKNSEE